MRVEIYWNLHRNLWSVRLVGGRVIGHVTSFVVQDAEFIVQPAGREKVRREKNKNVHAFVRGELLNADHLFANPWQHISRRVTYNPYKYDTFMGSTFSNENIEPIKTAECAELFIDDAGKPVVYAYDKL